MKLISIIVPCYNSEAYIDKCVQSLIRNNEQIEIILVNDGSTDGTSSKINDYEAKYPGRVKAIHQENKGHGGAVNTGIANASGEYIKVVDSDDWVNSDALSRIIRQIDIFHKTNQEVDMIISNFIYDKVGVENKMVMEYRDILPLNQVFGWKDIGNMPIGKYFLMHSVIYNRRILEKSKLILPEHTFYVDNLFVFLPLVKVDVMYYMDEDLYHYYIGREDQSVNEAIMIKRIDQQLKVNRLMLDQIDFRQIKEKHKKKYMIKYLNIVTAVSSIILLREGTKEALLDKRDLWRFIKRYDYFLYIRMRISLIGSILNIPGIVGRMISLFIYSRARKIVGFN